MTTRVGATRLAGDRAAALALFTLSLAIRLGYFAAYGAPPHSPDSEKYVRIAATLWQHGVFGTAAESPIVLDHALYPVLLAPFVGLGGAWTPWLPIAQCLLLALCAPLAYVTARRMAGPGAGWAAGLFAATHYGMIYYSTRFLTEALTGFWLLAIVALADRVLAGGDAGRRVRAAAVLGACFALAALTRVITLPLIGVSAVCIALQARRASEPARGALIALFTVGLVVYAPLPFRNAIASRDPGAEIVERAAGAAAPHTAEFIRRGDDLQTARFKTGQLIARAEASGERLERPIAPISWTALRHVGQRLAILFGVHPAVQRDRWPPPYVPSGHPLHHGWHYILFASIASAAVLAIRRRDIRIGHAILLPLALLFGYALVHAIPRYQSPSFFAWSVAAGIGAAEVARALRGVLLRIRQPS